MWTENVVIFTEQLQRSRRSSNQKISIFKMKDRPGTSKTTAESGKQQIKESFPSPRLWGRWGQTDFNLQIIQPFLRYCDYVLAVMWLFFSIYFHFILGISARQHAVLLSNAPSKDFEGNLCRASEDEIKAHSDLWTSEALATSTVACFQQPLKNFFRQ